MEGLGLNMNFGYKYDNKKTVVETIKGCLIFIFACRIIMPLLSKRSRIASDGTESIIIGH